MTQTLIAIRNYTHAPKAPQATQGDDAWSN
jgi:hypothetical protein